MTNDAIDTNKGVHTIDWADSLVMEVEIPQPGLEECCEIVVPAGMMMDTSMTTTKHENATSQSEAEHVAEAKNPSESSEQITLQDVQDENAVHAQVKVAGPNEVEATSKSAPLDEDSDLTSDEEPNQAIVSRPAAKKSVVSSKGKTAGRSTTKRTPARSVNTANKKRKVAEASAKSDNDDNVEIVIVKEKPAPAKRPSQSRKESVSKVSSKKTTPAKAPAQRNGAKSKARGRPEDEQKDSADVQAAAQQEILSNEEVGTEDQNAPKNAELAEDGEDGASPARSTDDIDAKDNTDESSDVAQVEGGNKADVKPGKGKAKKGQPRAGRKKVKGDPCISDEKGEGEETSDSAPVKGADNADAKPSKEKTKSTPPNTAPKTGKACWMDCLPAAAPPSGKDRPRVEQEDLVAVVLDIIRRFNEWKPDANQAQNKYHHLEKLMGFDVRHQYGWGEYMRGPYTTWCRNLVKWVRDGATGPIRDPIARRVKLRPGEEPRLVEQIEWRKVAEWLFKEHKPVWIELKQARKLGPNGNELLRQATNTLLGKIVAGIAT
ncbi:unnamed protein product [Parajaminaea phylloscopi]